MKHAVEKKVRCAKVAHLGMWLMACVFTVMLMPQQADAEKMTPPLTMTAAFDNSKPGLNRNEPLRITLSTTKAYSNLAIAVTLPPEIALISGNPAWKGALKVGERRELVLMVMLKTTGRYTINVNATFDPAESLSFTAARISLNIIAEVSSIVAAMEPFTVMDLKRAKTPAEQNRILGGQGIETQTPATLGTPAVLPSFLKPAAQPEKPATPQKPESRLRETLSVSISGIMTYKDASGAEHPIRLAKVEVINVNTGSTDEVMGTTLTGVDGAYAIVATGGDADSGPDIKVRVYCAIASDAVASVGPDTTSTYYLESAVHPDFTSSTLAVSLTTGAPVRGSAADDESARRFSVLDAMLQFAIEAYALRDGNLMPKIPVVFPATGTAYNKVDIYIKPQKSVSW
ncbi:MAG: hypothetical protein KKE37_03970 [Verrucomicrobia bacterium]|nr:hypothetical protein [Verrucomicrobiota bacterium]MBU4290600.1 hypothetical protein [Verrucomicrobiota bacterium]MBU4428494.1 hypothetical protein [Verrucomicrobiota bacterium]MCG2679369.1 hypothetical protein [Kiritimatiellia bacterium]